MININQEAFIKMPQICVIDRVPYRYLEQPNIQEEDSSVLDANSISTTLCKKYGFTAGSVKASVNIMSGPNENYIVGTLLHKDCITGSEIMIGGYLLCTYCEWGVSIAVWVPKDNWGGNWLEYQ